MPYANITCQIRNIHGHPARDCWWRTKEDRPNRADRGDRGDRGNKDANLAAANGVDTNWYCETGATEHLTSQLNKLTTYDPYPGQDRVRTADGSGMHISHIGQSVLSTLHHSFSLKDILHVPHATKNLLSVHRFTLDNHAFIEFHPFYFLIKNRGTRRTLFRGP
jgi:hypothetical protein